MKTLVYGRHRWDASTPDKERLAIRRLFWILDEVHHVYASDNFLKDEIMKKIKKLEKIKILSRRDFDELNHQRGLFDIISEQCEWYRMAKDGDDIALRWLLNMRRGIIYQKWSIVDLEEKEPSRK